MTMLRTRKINQREYFLWLCSLLKINIRTDKDKIEFFWELHQKRFYWSVPNDDNREEDGKKLREVFVEDEIDGNEILEDLDGPCSVFEMLVALAGRMDYILTDSDKGDRTDKWFNEMINNLGLEWYSSNNPHNEERLRNNNTRLDNMLSRNYTFHGRGGLFPLRYTKKDQRRVEIWYQMQEWLQENNIE